MLRNRILSRTTNACYTPEKLSVIMEYGYGETERGKCSKSVGTRLSRRRSFSFGRNTEKGGQRRRLVTKQLMRSCAQKVQVVVTSIEIAMTA